MNADHVTTRLKDALHRGSHKATEQELAEVAAVVLAIVGELTAEMAVIIGDLSERVTKLEGRP
jgi:NTP pyrophosphatase (non-canonical NTP hydrolase)